MGSVILDTYKTVATEMEIQFLNTWIMFPSLLPQIWKCIFLFYRRGCPNTFVYIVYVQVIVFGDEFLAQGLHLHSHQRC